jgi:HAD superfamily hydrolase (TIGR01509 family)
MGADRFAWIFDFDGVLVNTMEAHFACYSRACAGVGVPIERRQFFSQAGMTGREQIAYFAARAGKTIDVDAVYRRKGELFLGHLDEVLPIPAGVELLATVRAAGSPTAIASGSSRPSMLPVIERLGLACDAVVTSEDVSRGKPNPDLFLKAAELLGAPPGRCLVVEDSDAGIEAARRAGMASLRFTDRAPRGEGT